MKIAFLLTLYNNPEQANIFIKQILQYPESYIFIHIDKKSKEIESSLVKNERVKIIPENYNVEWGDYSQIQANLALMKYVLNTDDFQYISVHSGNDLLVRKMDDLVEFLKQDHKYAYLDCNPLPYEEYQYGGGLGRIALKWPKVFRKKYGQYSPIRVLRSLYGKAYGAKILKGKELPREITFYGQSDWFTLSGDCTKNIINYVRENESFVELFRDSLIGSELFFNTLVYLTKGKNEISADDNLRYIDFSNPDKKTPGSPKLLTIDDKEKILASKMFFARKVDIKNINSKELIESFTEIV